MASILPFRRTVTSATLLRSVQVQRRFPATQNGGLRIAPLWTSSPTLYATSSNAQVEPPEHLSEGERKVFDIINESLQPTLLEVQDISGGCGSMYALDIVSEHFKGLPVIKQHRMVNKVLGEEIKKWHGVRLKTKAP